MNINWDSAPKGAEKLIQNNEHLRWLKDGFVWREDEREWIEDDFPQGDILIATRPQEAILTGSGGSGEIKEPIPISV